MRKTRGRGRRRLKRSRRSSRKQRGGMRTPIIEGEWNGAPVDDRCKTLVYRPADHTDPHGSPRTLVRQCDLIGKEGQLATPI